MKKLLLLSLTIFLLSCERIKEGTVIAIELEPARHYVHMMPIFHRVGKITTVSYIPINKYDDEDYKIEIEGYTKKHKLQDRWIYIPKEMFDTIKVGDWYCIDKRCHISPNADITE